MCRWSRKQKVWGLAIVCGLLLRAFFALHHPLLDGDTLFYGDLAQNLLHHHVYGVTDGAHIRPTLIRLPGYPFFLAACFTVFGDGSYTAAVWLQILLALASYRLLAGSLDRLLGTRVATTFLWLSCLCPFTAEYEALALTEGLALVCLSLSLFALERWYSSRQSRWAVLLGILGACALFLRPDRGLLPLACVVAMLLVARKAAWKPVALVCLMMALPMTVWTWRNEHVLHVFQPLAPKYANDPGEYVSTGFNRWYRTWAMEYCSTVNVYWEWDGAALRMADLPPRAIDNESERATLEHAFAAYNRNFNPTPQLDAVFQKLADERTARHPWRSYVQVPVGKLADMWLRPRTEFFALPLAWWKWRLHPWGSLVCALYAALNLLLLLTAVWGAILWSRWWTHPLPLAAISFVLLRSLLLLTIDNSEQRYTVECLPVALLLAAVALSRKTSTAALEGSGTV